MFIKVETRLISLAIVDVSVLIFLTERSSRLVPGWCWLYVCIDNHPAPAGLKLGVWWSGGVVTVPAQSCVTSQSDQMESPPLHSPGYRLSDCPDHHYDLPINWLVMEFNISPDIISSTSKWKISFSRPIALLWLLVDGFHFIMKVIGWTWAPLLFNHLIIWLFKGKFEQAGRL